MKHRLKKPGVEGFPAGVCAAKGCKLPSEMVDATHRWLDQLDIPFCCPCWADIDDEYHELNPKPKPAPVQPPPPAPEPEPEPDEPMLFVKAGNDTKQLVEDIAKATEKPKLFG